MAHVLLSMQVHRLCWCDVVHLILLCNPILSIRSGEYVGEGESGIYVCPEKRNGEANGRVHEQSSFDVCLERVRVRVIVNSCWRRSIHLFAYSIRKLRTKSQEWIEWSKIEYFNEWHTPVSQHTVLGDQRAKKREGKTSQQKNERAEVTSPLFLASHGSLFSSFSISLFFIVPLISFSFHSNFWTILLFFCLLFVCLFVVIIFLGCLCSHNYPSLTHTTFFFFLFPSLTQTLLTPLPFLSVSHSSLVQLSHH